MWFFVTIFFFNWTEFKIGTYKDNNKITFKITKKALQIEELFLEKKKQYGLQSLLFYKVIQDAFQSWMANFLQVIIYSCVGLVDLNNTV